MKKFIPMGIVALLVIWAANTEWCSRSKHHVVGCEKHGFTHTRYVERHGECVLQYEDSKMPSEGECSTPKFW
jgi:hypothetical protein